MSNDHMVVSARAAGEECNTVIDSDFERGTVQASSWGRFKGPVVEQNGHLLVQFGLTELMDQTKAQS